MGLDDKVKNAAKNLEGKAQEAYGDVTGDPEHKAEGKAKQGEAEVRNAGENAKDKIKKAID